MSVQDRPTAAELVDAVREFLERDVLPSSEGRAAFHARVAINALTIVERELVLGPEIDERVRSLLVTLLREDAPLRDLVALFARRIRDGSLDDRQEEVLAATRELVRAKLEVSNPRYCERRA